MKTVTISIEVPETMAPYLDEYTKPDVERNTMVLYPFQGDTAKILGIDETDLFLFYESIGMPSSTKRGQNMLEEMATLEAVR